MSGAVAIELVPWDPAWPAAFVAEAERIRGLADLDAVRVDHVGSTAVPGLAAKPVIDLQISLRRLHPLEPHVAALARLGYRHVAHPDDATYPFLHRPEGWPHSHHVHLCEAGGEEERRHLAFRDYLRDHPAERDAYLAEKQRLAAEAPAGSFESRNAYAEAKGGFIAPRIRRALELGYPRESR